MLPRIAFPLMPRRPRQAGPRHAGPPRRRALAATVLLLLLIALYYGWRVAQQRPVSLPVVNHSTDTITLRLYGDGVLQAVEISELLPHDRVEVELLLAAEGALRLGSESASAHIDSLLLQQASALRGRNARLEIRDGNRFLLVEQ